MDQSLLSFWIQVLSHPQRNTEYTPHRLSYNESASKQKDNCSNKVTFTVLNVISFPFITLSSSHGSSQVILTVQSILLLLTYIVSALSSSSVFKVR